MMSRARLLSLGLALALAGCHAATPTTLSQDRASAKPPPDAIRKTGESPKTDRFPPLVTADPSALPLQTERDDPDASACEWSCADVHDCALLAGNYTPAAAASIELGCVRACLSSANPPATREAVFGCQRPEQLEPDACNPFLDCVAVAWPDGRRVQPIIDETPLGDGCTRGCEAFARCYDSSTTADKVARCGEMCRQALDQSQQALFGECARKLNCDEVISCVAATPGA